MATYPKKLKTLEIHLLLNGGKTTVADTATDAKASRALMEFKNYQPMYAEGGYIPYHAVQYIKVTETDGQMERKDPYCGE